MRVTNFKNNQKYPIYIYMIK